MNKKFVYMFHEGNSTMRELLGGKGANLAEMTNLGLPIPTGFTVSTEACTIFNKENHTLPNSIKDEIEIAMKKIEEQSGKKFGDYENPLLVSVRSGARASMPGMMDTVLNLGLNHISVEGLSKLTNNPRFAYDSYRRFIMMFSDVVMGIHKSKFEKELDLYKEKMNYTSDLDLTAEDLKNIVKKFREIYLHEKGKDFPDNAKEQLYEAIGAVFSSWDNPRAFIYRKMNDIPYDWGTAVNVQSMVFGNMGNTSGTGVVFSRNVASGEKVIYGEYMVNAQGEDVVAGIRTPKPFAELKEEMPEIYSEFVEYSKMLEKHYKNVQDMEITIENSKLYFLQTRNAKRTAQAALKIAVDMVEEGLITEEEAIMMVDSKQLGQLLYPVFDPKVLKESTPIGKGIPASPGAACGKIYFSAEDVKEAVEKGEKAVLVRFETSPEDIEGMNLSQGVLTVHGGTTSHAAVVARGMGRCCVSGCESIKMFEEEKYFILNKIRFVEGDYISLNGTTGNIFQGKIETSEPKISGDFAKFMTWADKHRTLGVRTNADTPRGAKKALEFGAEGIGLTRTEHMFFKEDRIPKMQQMILSDTEEERRNALDLLLPFQKDDFINLYEAMEGRPVTVRLLDPPLHEFLPTHIEEFQYLSKTMNKSIEDLKEKAHSLHEFNPMIGHRGCRLAVSYPEIAQMQTRAIIEAAISVKKEKGYEIIPEIMVPLICDVKELNYIKNIINSTAENIMKNLSTKIEYHIGTMIELPRAALLADEIATEAEFFSFGTNDLTQMTYGLSRDDSGQILEDYMEAKIFNDDPTSKLDQTGVGQLIKIAIEKGKSTNPKIKLGICGEHGSDPSSIDFFHMVGLDYISCSPYRVPIARLSAAQSAIRHKK